MDDVISMMPQGYLVASQLLCHLEQLFTAIPRTKETGRLAIVGMGIKRSGDHMELDSPILTEILQIAQIALILDVLHADVQGFNREPGFVYALSHCQKMQQTERILAARKTYQQTVAIFNETIIVNGFLQAT